MEKPDTTIPETLPEISDDSVAKKNKLAGIGFACMLAGPAILILASIFTSMFGDMSQTAADIVAWTAAIPPGIGFLIGCIVLVVPSLRKKTGKLGLAFANITVIMCNPIFYLFYLIICDITAAGLAERAFLENM